MRDGGRTSHAELTKKKCVHAGAATSSGNSGAPMFLYATSQSQAVDDDNRIPLKYLQVRTS